MSLQAALQGIQIPTMDDVEIESKFTKEDDEKAARAMAAAQKRKQMEMDGG